MIVLWKDVQQRILQILPLDNGMSITSVTISNCDVHTADNLVALDENLVKEF